MSKTDDPAWGADVDLSIDTPEKLPYRHYTGKHDHPLVYFLSSVDVPECPVKIGVSSSPTARAYELSFWSPYKLTILAIAEGGKDRERVFHKRFASARLHGEWFARTPELMRLIAWYGARKKTREVQENVGAVLRMW